MAAPGVVRTSDWDNPRGLRKAVRELGRIMGRQFRVVLKDAKHAKLVILHPRHEITNDMSIAELRAFVEGMLVVI